MRDLKQTQQEAENAEELVDEDGVNYNDLSPRQRRALLARKGLVRIDELVEASGFGRQLQEELEAVRFVAAAMLAIADVALQYMLDVADQPGEGENDVSSEGESGEESESEEEEEESEEDEVDDVERRARDLRLGNTNEENDEDEDNVPELHDHGAPKRTFPTAPSSVGGRSNATSRTNRSRTTQGSRTSEGSDMKSIVASDLARQRQRSEGKHHTRKGLSSAGRVKGSKWKESVSAKVGQNSAQGGMWN